MESISHQGNRIPGEIQRNGHQKTPKGFMDKCYAAFQKLRTYVSFPIHRENKC